MLNSKQTDKTVSTDDALAQLQAEGQKQSHPNPALSESKLSRLHEMDREALLALVRRMACQCGLVALMTKDETAQAMRDVLAETALKPIVQGLNMKADIAARLTAIDKWLDRDEGKPMQRQMIAAQVDVRSDSMMAQADETAERMIQIAMDRRKKG